MFSLYGGAVIGVVGLLMMVTGNAAMGFIVLVAGVGLVLNHFSKKKGKEESREKINAQFDEKKESGQQAIRAVLAEVVDYRREFARKDAVSSEVVGFLEGLTPQQYMRQIEGQSRRINTRAGAAK